jgi:hypothetical protein
MALGEIDGDYLAWLTLAQHRSYWQLLLAWLLTLRLAGASAPPLAVWTSPSGWPGCLWSTLSPWRAGTWPVWRE